MPTPNESKSKGLLTQRHSMHKKPGSCKPRVLPNRSLRLLLDRRIDMRTYSASATSESEDAAANWAKAACSSSTIAAALKSSPLLEFQRLSFRITGLADALFSNRFCQVNCQHLFTDVHFCLP